MENEASDKITKNFKAFLGDKNASWKDFFSKASLAPAYWIIIISNLSVFFLPGVNLSIDAATLLWIYLSQSIMIGMVHVLKLWFYKFGEATGPAEWKSPRKLAIFFIFHYGFFHFVYSFFLPPSAANWTTVLEGAAVFSFALIWNTIVHYKTENSGEYNANDFMFLPYLRIIPIHIAIIVGGFFSALGGTFLPVLVVLMLMKTAMELGMEYFQQLGFSLKKLKEIAIQKNEN